jgi:hypothetical protein
MSLRLEKPQPQPHLKITIGITLAVALFFAVRAEAETPAASMASAGVSEIQWKTVEDRDMTEISAITALDQVQSALQNLNSSRNCPQKASMTLGVPTAYYQEWVKEGVPEAALKKALAYEMNDPHAGDPKKAITNKEWMSIIDYTAPSNRQRLFVLNLKTGEVIKALVAHGRGSDNGTGKEAVKFSNANNSHATSPGFIKIGGHITSPSHGPAFHLEGLEARNSAVADRAVILHSAKYVSADFVQAHGYTGRSWGCPAVSPEMLKVLYTKNIPGSLLYGYTSEDASGA